MFGKIIRRKNDLHFEIILKGEENDKI